MDTNIDEFLKQARIIGENETYDIMVDRVFDAIADVNSTYGSSNEDIKKEKNEWSQLFRNKRFVPSTPILTNGGIRNRPLSACSVPPLHPNMTRTELEKMVNHYHKKGMGTGFNFDDSKNPIDDLLYLNQIAVGEFERNEMVRPVGNIGILSVDHPAILDFAAIKSTDRGVDWKFNTSINLNNKFIEAVKGAKLHTQKDGSRIYAPDLMDKIIEYAHDCGDPGLLFLDRFEQYNITPHLGKYVSLAPCGEVPMASGETCQFSYINVGNFVSGSEIDYETLNKAVHSIVKMLDNCLDISIANIENQKSKEINSKKRKIGLGICGFQDLLWKLGLSYESQEAILVAEDLMSFINYESKVASVQLAQDRGAFPAITDSQTRKDLIVNRYLGTNSRTVSSSDWENLKQQIDTYGIRNVSTTALPPTGRSSLVIGASASIEPAFRLSDELSHLLEHNPLYGSISSLKHEKNKVYEFGSCQNSNFPKDIKNILKTCLEIAPVAHLKMVAAFQKYTDDAISKTVNLPYFSTCDDIKNTYMMAYDLGLKGITVFRDGCKNQPKNLVSEALK